MAIVNPFKGVRPVRDKVSLVASRSYLSYSKETLIEKLENNPYTFLHIINPDFSNKQKAKNLKHKFQMVKDKFKSFVHKGVFIEDQKDCFYIYQQTNGDNNYLGLICASSIQDYLDGTIKIHEQTLSSREDIFTDYLQTTGFNAEPVLITHQDNDSIDEILQKYTLTRAEYEFTTTNHALHKLWVMEDLSDIQFVQEEFKKMECLYIADGHHRSASSAKLFQLSPSSKCRSSFMSYLLSESQLKILNFNRLVTDINGMRAEDFLTEIAKSFQIEKSNVNIALNKNDIGLYISNQWYRLSHDFKDLSGVSSLAPSILTDYILSPIIGISDLKTDKRISFAAGSITKKDLSEKVDDGKAIAAFVLNAVSVKELKSVADNNQIMPPKSTYIEPKMRSGLMIYKIDE
jgi:uncharacterized protein (DUF1015 family)